MKLSKNFYLGELIKSNTADRLGILNVPTNQDIIDNLRAVGSKDTSQHIKGEAVDFEVPGITNLEIFYWIKDNLDFDQLILEYYKKDVPNSGWVHASYKKLGNRNQAIEIK